MCLVNFSNATNNSRVQVSSIMREGKNCAELMRGSDFFLRASQADSREDGGAWLAPVVPWATHVGAGLSPLLA